MYSSAETLLTHYRTDHNYRHVCTVCKRQYTNRGDLERHYDHVHPLTIKPLQHPIVRMPPFNLSKPETNSQDAKEKNAKEKFTTDGKPKIDITSCPKDGRKPLQIIPLEHNIPIEDLLPKKYGADSWAEVRYNLKDLYEEEESSWDEMETSTEWTESSSEDMENSMDEMEKYLNGMENSMESSFDGMEDSMDETEISMDEMGNYTIRERVCMESEGHKPGRQKQKLGGLNQKPGVQNQELGGLNPKPGAQNYELGRQKDLKPSAHNVGHKPGGQNQKSGGQNQKPGLLNQKPGGQNQKPGGQNQKPGGQNQKPSEQSQKPVAQNHEPGGQKDQKPSAHNVLVKEKCELCNTWIVGLDEILEHQEVHLYS